MKEYIVYKVTFPNNKCYIGITSKSLQYRKKAHYKRLKQNLNWKFYNALNKYKNKETWDIIAKTTSWNKVCKLEREYIKKFNSCIEGYNSTSGGEGNYNPCAKVRKKMSIWQKGKKLSKEHKHKLSKAKLNKKRKPHSKETKRKMSESRKNSNKVSYKYGKSHHNSTKIVCLETLEVFDSINNCSNILNIHRSGISNVLNGRAKTAGGLTFKKVSSEEVHIGSQV